MKKDEMVRFRVTSDYLKELDEISEKHNKTRTSFILEAVDILKGFDVVFFNTLKNFAESSNIPIYEVIQRMILKRMIKEDVYAKVWGGYHDLLDEFYQKVVDGKSELISIEELKKILVERYTTEEERNFAKSIYETKYKYNLKVSEKEEKLMKKYKYI